MGKTTICTIILCLGMIALQVGFILAPISFIAIYIEFVRPALYVILAAIFFAVLGIKHRHRPSKTAFQANMAAVLSVVLFAAAIVAISFWFGGGRNGRFAGAFGLLLDFWALGLPLVLAEMMRFKLLKTMKDQYKGRTAVIVVLTLVFAFTQMSGLRVLNFTGQNALNVIFSSVLPALVTSAVITFIALKGTLFAAASVSFVYNLGAMFSPLLPDIDGLVWGIVLCALLFFVGVLFHGLTNDLSQVERRRLAKMAKYEPRKGLKMTLSLAASGFIFAFFLQLFPVYPVVILTGSMTGYIDRGSIAIMRRMPADEVLDRVQIGDVLHYSFRDVELVHRVIDFQYINDDLRVFVTKGDANEFPDSVVLHQENVIGRHLFSIPFIGYPNVILRAILGGGL